MSLPSDVERRVIAVGLAWPTCGPPLSAIDWRILAPGDVRGAREAIQELAGHKELGMTKRYMRPSPAALDAAIRLLDDPIPGVKGLSAIRIVETMWRPTLSQSHKSFSWS